MFTPAAGAATDNCHPGNSSPKHQSGGCTTPPRTPGSDGELRHSALQPYYCHTSPVHRLVDDEQLVRDATLPQLPLTIGCAIHRARRMPHHSNNPNNSDSITVCTPAVNNIVGTNPGRRRCCCCCVPTSADNCHGPATTACLKQPTKKHMFLKLCEVWHCQGCCSKERDHTILQSELLLQRACIEPRSESLFRLLELNCCHIYSIYIYICVCVCVCVWSLKKERTMSPLLPLA
jgi:hypothetical protein